MNKPNISLILMDQVRRNMLGTYGHNLVKTPNLDLLAGDALKFERAYTPAAVCCPARTSLFTGQMPSSHKIIRNVEKAEVKDPQINNPNIISNLRNYEKIYIGKWHVGGKILPKDFGFIGHNFDGYGYPGSGVYENLIFNQGPITEKRYKEWLKEKSFEIPKVTDSYFGENPHLKVQELCGKLSCPKEATLPFFIVDEAIRYIEENKKSRMPFFIWMNFWGPHTPCLIPEPYYSMYNPEEIILDESFYRALENKPLHYKNISKMWGMWDAPENRWKEVISKFWGYITLIDEAIGIYINYLKKNGLYEEMFIAVTADHGDAMGAHKMIEKGEFMLEDTYVIPMIIKSPGNKRSGELDDSFVYLHDLTPTISEISGGGQSKFFEGKSLLDNLEGRKFTKRKGILAQLAGHFVSFEQRMWRTENYKLVFNASDLCELYDMKNDPQEIENLFYKEECKETKRKLLYELHEEMVKIGDPLSNWLYRIIDSI